MTAPIPFSVTGYESFEEMYRAEYAFVQGIIYKKIKEKSLVDELSQDTFLKVFQKLDSYVPQDSKEYQESFRSWLGTIAKNTALNYISRNNKAKAYLNGINVSNRTGRWNESTFTPNKEGEKTYQRGLGYKIQNPLTPEELLIEKETVESIEKILEGLPYQQTAVLYFLEDLAYQEIAEVQSIPIGTVMSRLNRARKKLQESGIYR